MNKIPDNRSPHFFQFNEKNKELQKAIVDFKQNVEKKAEVNKQDIGNLNRVKLSSLEERLLRILAVLIRLVCLDSKKIKNVLEKQKTINNIIYFYKKTSSLYSDPDTLKKVPFVFTAEKLNKIATRCKFKALKAEFNIACLNHLQASVQANVPVDTQGPKNISKEIKQLLNNLVKTYSDKLPRSKQGLIRNFKDLLANISIMTNLEGQNIIQQLNVLYIKKQSCYSELAKLHVIKQKLEQGLDHNQLQKNFQNLQRKTLSIDLQQATPSNVIDAVAQAIKNQYASIKKIDDAFEDFLAKVHEDLSVYEVSANRLIEEFPPRILTEPIKVTMIGVEYTGFVKEGGLAEALEGMTKAMKVQHPGNKVRLIFPKFNILPQNIKDRLDQVEPVAHPRKNGKSYNVYTIEIDEIEYNFIEDDSFVLKGEKPSVYGPDNESQKERFAMFSSLAADFVKTVDTDVIHLHDWHVAGVALKLYQDSKENEEEIPPIVFTYHNNSRASQGRFAAGIYNYDPVIQGLIEAGIATENINVFVEVIKKADAVTTVSETFGIESQEILSGEGVSFAAREAAESGKLTGIINGSNPHSWNPEKDLVLKNWKDPETHQPIDLTYGPNYNEKEIIEKKEVCKTQLRKWVSQNFPKAKMDFTKPIVTYIGRLDSYQKGLDKLEEAIKETIKGGGQFIIMGSLEDDGATAILDRLQANYKEGVLFIRDYKNPNGRYHFQQGDDSRQGCGSLVRAASEFLLIPSKFEPCGLVQFEGWLFGSLAIGSDVGGLADTIISPEKNPKEFNGFLFNRDSSEANSLGSAIQTALTTWKGYTTEEKGRIARRLIEDGRKYSWTTSPTGYSPVEKYRFVYENAKKFAALRKVESSNVNIKARLHKISAKNLTQHHKSSPSDQLEESYNQYFYSKKFKFKKLEKMYKALPEYARMQVPSPYGHKVDFQAYETLGSHLRPEGVNFIVEAPEAENVKVRVFDAMGKPTIYSLTRLDNGNWTGLVPHLKAGTRYQYIVNGKTKLDPYGLSHVPSPEPGEPPCSVAVDRGTYNWQDNEWMTSRIEKAGKSIPTSIYEVHPSSWKKKNGHYLNYREIANELVAHCKKLGYTHVELMGILEHPDERSWGYQVTGFFAPNSRMGSPEDFKYLVDTLHKNGIGIYLDWIPAHFAKDSYALSDFDGSNQYQPSKMAMLFSLRSVFFKWGTHFFDFDKKNVRRFLTSSASYWLKEMHIDGLRVDAVRSILLSENMNAGRRFLKDLNAIVHKEFPGVMMIAEDYSGSTETTKSVAVNGLGFDQKWNVGWMKYSLEYFSQSPKNRPAFYDKIVTAVGVDTFHKMILAISHDEVSKEMKSLIEKNSGLTVEEKFANLRAFFSFMMSVPGKKLMFMGTEIGAETGWDDFIGKEKGIMDVDVDENKQKIMLILRRLNEIYQTYKPFWQHDDNAHDLIWIEKKDPEKRIHAYRRKSDDGKSIACLHNFSDVAVKEFVVKFENKEKSLDITPREIFNSDSQEFGGQGRTNIQIELIKDESGTISGYKVQVPPLSSLFISES